MKPIHRPVGATPAPGPQLRPNPDVIAQRIGDKIALLHLKTDRFYELNRTGARLWELLSAGYDRARIQEQLLLEFDVDAAQLTDEIDAMLASLKDENLVGAYGRD